MKKIEFTRVTWYSQIIAIILFVGVFFLGYYIGQIKRDTASQAPSSSIINAKFACADNKTISALFYNDQVELTLSDGRTMLLPQAISADGGRYANQDESFVFWNKGNTAFVQEKGKTTFDQCVTSQA